MRVLISGGGIAGPAAAFWLRRAGAEVTIVETASGPRPGGHAVDVRGIARAVVERMGLLETIKENRVDERGIAVVDRNNRRRGVMMADAFGGEGIVAEIEIARGDLGRILYDATAGYTDYRFGDRIVRLEQDVSGVDVTFRSGGTERFDLVIGADGVHSGVRALAFGPEEEFVRYLGGYGAYFTVPDPGDTDNLFYMYNAPGGLVAGLRPERGGTAKASLTFSSAEPAYERIRRAEAEKVLAERLSGAGWRVDEFLAAMPSADDFFFDSVNQVRVRTWHRGRVVLLGDAAACGSPLAGLGTSVALVGAYVLAGELAVAGGDHERGLPAYQGVLDAYAKAAMELPPGGFRGFAPHSRFMIWLRAKTWNMMGRWPMSAIMRKMINRADAITLPDYTFSANRVYR
ncbi:MAG TPA: FAD-dependent monooxygenase [Actinoplanes sp.]|jgi:2-polyprenyl-6-methoxyphenol hydroxylase-like FAD-dependent oxidoreductase